MNGSVSTNPSERYSASAPGIVAGRVVSKHFGVAQVTRGLDRLLGQQASHPGSAVLGTNVEPLDLARQRSRLFETSHTHDARDLTVGCEGEQQPARGRSVGSRERARSPRRGAPNTRPRRATRGTRRRARAPLRRVQASPRSRARYATHSRAHPSCSRSATPASETAPPEQRERGRDLAQPQPRDDRRVHGLEVQEGRQQRSPASSRARTTTARTRSPPGRCRGR